MEDLEDSETVEIFSSKYKLGKRVSRGAFGYVHSATSRTLTNGNIVAVAVKIIFMNKIILNPDELDALDSEEEIVGLLKH
ncbi:hypothetical protein HK098_006479, partial [Nowakowskiella sp. JEL0407]